MAPVRVTDSDVLAMLTRMNMKDRKIPIAKPRYRVAKHVRISNKKIKLAKGGEKNYTTKVFRTIKVIRRTPRPVYELEDLNHKVIDGQFYNEELIPVQITKRTISKLIKFQIQGHSR
jgi:hypothetical protein